MWWWWEGSRGDMAVRSTLQTIKYSIRVKRLIPALFQAFPKARKRRGRRRRARRKRWQRW